MTGQYFVKMKRQRQMIITIAVVVMLSIILLFLYLGMDAISCLPQVITIETISGMP